MLCSDLLSGDFRTHVTIFFCKNMNRTEKNTTKFNNRVAPVIHHHHQITITFTKSQQWKPEMRNWNIIKHKCYKRFNCFIILLLLLLLHCFIVCTRWNDTSPFFIVHLVWFQDVCFVDLTSTAPNCISFHSIILFFLVFFFFVSILRFTC